MRLIRRGGGEYPARLEHLDLPPERLWASGPLPLPADRMVAIVGTRRATEYGRRMARDIAYGVAVAGWTVVSGMARGIDAAAHRGALDANGATVAVLGCGVDRVYPTANRDLRRRMLSSGLLLTEFEPGALPLKHHFPRRNRIIAALAEAVVVVQAGLPSGALITADYALAMSRDVLAVPGPADQAASRGTHRLLRDGATIVTSAFDVLVELGSEPATADADPAPLLPLPGHAGSTSKEPAEKVRARLLEGPASLDELAAGAGMAVPEAVATLGRMELGGVVRSLPGLRYELVKRP